MSYPCGMLCIPTKKGLTMSDYFDDYDYDSEGSAIRVYDDCSCDVNYTCRKCLSKW